MLFVSVLEVHAASSDDMLIYSDRFNNGWGDSWSWMPRYATNNPVYAGSNAMACVPSGQFQAWWLKSATTVDATHLCAGRPKPNIKQTQIEHEKTLLNRADSCRRIAVCH